MTSNISLNLNKVLDTQTYAFKIDNFLKENTTAITVSSQVLFEVTTRLLFKQKYRKVQSIKFSFFNKKMKISRYKFKGFKQSFFKEKGFITFGVSGLVNRLIPNLASFDRNRNEIFFESGDKRDLLFNFFDVMQVYRFTIRFFFPGYSEICDSDRQRINFFRELALKKLIKPINVQKRFFPYLFLLHMGFQSRNSWSQGEIFFISGCPIIKFSPASLKLYKFNRSFIYLFLRKRLYMNLF